MNDTTTPLQAVIDDALALHPDDPAAAAQRLARHVRLAPPAG